MGLNKQKGNMYKHVTHTWNPLGGKCPHGCSYCSTNKMMYRPVIKEKYSGPVRLVEKELKTNLGKGNTIFVCGQHDLFAEGINPKWVIKILDHCSKYENIYYLQTKNPAGFSLYGANIAALHDFILCVTIETNRHYRSMGLSPPTIERSFDFAAIPWENKHVTIEPVMDFDVLELVGLIHRIKPIQVNIGADSGGNNLPEPDHEKLSQLVSILEKLTKVHLKSNIKRIMNELGVEFNLTRKD